jgi:hypothetical protein
VSSACNEANLRYAAGTRLIVLAVQPLASLR